MGLYFWLSDNEDEGGLCCQRPLLIVLQRFYRSSNGSSITAWGDVCRWDCIPSYQHIALVLYDPRTQIFGFDGKIVALPMTGSPTKIR